MFKRTVLGTDPAQLRTHQHGDPFHTLLQALAHGTVLVFDVETTGLSSTEDEVIDLGAVKPVAGRMVEPFDTLLRPTRSLGDSAAVHGITEEILHSHGRARRRHPLRKSKRCLQALRSNKPG